MAEICSAIAPIIGLPTITSPAIVVAKMARATLLNLPSPPSKVDANNTHQLATISKAINPRLKGVDEG